MHPFDLNDSTYSQCTDLLVATCSVQNDFPVNGCIPRLPTRQVIVSTPAVKYGCDQNKAETPTPVKRARVSKKATPKKSASAYNRDYQKMIGSSLEKLLLILVLPTAPIWTRFFELAREQNF
jgi:hypothetical protein